MLLVGGSEPQKIEEALEELNSIKRLERKIALFTLISTIGLISVYIFLSLTLGYDPINTIVYWFLIGINSNILLRETKEYRKTKKMIAELEQAIELTAKHDYQGLQNMGVNIIGRDDIPESDEVKEQRMKDENGN